MSDETAPQQRGAETRTRQSTPNALLSAFGRLTRDPEERTSDRGHPYTRARVACNLTPPRLEGKQYTLFFDLTAFRHQGAALAKCRRGDRVHVMGTLTMEQRKADDGREYQNFSLVADGLLAAAATKRTE